MSNITQGITVKIQAEGRPCWVTRRSAGRLTRLKAFLHIITTKAFVVEPSPLKGGHPGGQISRPVAIVETEDGAIIETEIENVQLLDTDKLLEENGAAWDQTQSPKRCNTCKHADLAENEMPCKGCYDASHWEDMNE